MNQESLVQAIFVCSCFSAQGFSEQYLVLGVACRFDGEDLLTEEI